MKRKLTSALLTIALVLSLSVPAFAADCSKTPGSTCPSGVLWQVLQQYGCGSDSGSANGGQTQFNLNDLLSQFLQAARNAANQSSTPLEQPEIPAQPETPAEPEKPAQPAEPETPVQSETPTQPTTPTQTETPTQPTEQETAAASFMSAYEQEVVRLVNVERAKAGLAPLTADAQLTRTARMKSQDMHDKGYFDHTSPTYGSPFDLMKSQGVKYRTAGENIAMGYRTPEAVVNAWMNSSGHRANILNSSYTKIGVGYVASGSYWTQHFTG